MSKVIIKLNEKSVNDALKLINQLKFNLVKGTMISEFLEGVCKWLIFRASNYVKNSDIGNNIKDDINQHWSYVVRGKSAKVTNDSEKAVFVEFGVGSVGEQIPHDNATKAGYDYNINPLRQGNNPYWVFPVDDFADVDMHEGYLSEEKSDGGFWIITKGSWRVMYAYQAIVDAKQDLQNPNGEIAQIWKTVKARYI